MKIRSPWLIKGAALVGTWAVRLWMRTLRYQYQPLGPNVDPDRSDLEGRNIYVLWHENLLFPAYRYARPDVWVLISQHADGEIIADVCRRLGFSLVRGSTTRHSVEAVRQMLRIGPNAHLALTPDGPSGPRRRVQPGVIYLAARTGLPIIPVGLGFQRPWRLKSWDRFVVPRPWTTATCVTGEAIVVPPGADKDQLEYYRQMVEQSMLEVTVLAERWADIGQSPSNGGVSKPERHVRHSAQAVA